MGPHRFRFFVVAALGVLIFAGALGVAVFFALVQGEDQTMVPDVRGEGLAAAILKLQVKELNPRIRLRYSQSAKDQGLILEQDPPAGAIVKAGRRIWLVVSQGAVIDHVENYVGRNIEQIQKTIAALGAASSGVPLFSIQEPFMYEYDSSPPGTILEQEPLPGTNVSGPTQLTFVVSRGAEDLRVPAPDLRGRSIEAALLDIGRAGVNFRCTVRPPLANETGETVVSQSPDPGTLIPITTPVELVVTTPVRVPEGQVFGLFRYGIPRNVYPLTVRLDATLPTGETRELIAVPFIGGDFTVPYTLPTGTILKLYMLDRELHQEEVAPAVSDFSLEQL